MRRVHRELPQTKAQQHAREPHVTSHLTAHGDRYVGAVGAADDVRHQIEHRRMQRIVEMRHGIVGAVDRKHVLDQVVGADRQEVELAGKRGQRQRGGRDFDHTADRDSVVVGDAIVVEAALGFLEVMQRLVEFVRRGQHRDQDAHLAVVRCLQDCAQLAVKHLRLGQAQPDRAQSQRRIGRDAFGGVDMFVGTKIESAYGDRSAVHFLHDAPIGLELLVFARRVAPVQVEKFRAEQAHTVRTVVPRVGNVIGQFDVGVQFDGSPVGCGCFGFLEPPELESLEFPLLLAQLVFGKHRLVGIDDDHAIAAVDDQDFIFADQRARVVQRHHRRNVQAAGDDCGVRRGAAQIGDEACELVAFELDDVRRGQVVGHENAVFLRRAARQDLAGASHQDFQDALDNLDDVGLAVPQIAVFYAFELIDQRIHLQLERPFGIALQ